MKSLKNTTLYSRLALITSVTLVVGYFVVYAVYTTIDSAEVAPSATITSTLMGKIKTNFDDLSTRVTTLEGSIAGASVWSKVGSDINYTAGKVGIGTTTPAASLDVKRTAADIQFAGWIEGSDVNNYGLGVNIANTTSAKAIADFKSGNTSRLFVRADGNVGIGTVSPLRKLHVSGDWIISDNTYGLLGLNTTGGQKIIAQMRSDNSYGFGESALVITSGGNVGIGTTSPNQFGGTNLIVNGSQSVIGLQIGGVNAIRFVSDSSNSYIWEGRNSPLILGTSDTERMRIDGVGNVGIGTNAPYAGSMLDVNGAIRARGGLLLQYGSVLKVNDPGCPSGYTQLACSGTRCLCWAP